MNNIKGSFIVCICMLITGCNMNNAKELKYKGEDLTGKVSLSRNKQSKQAELIVEVSGNWELYRTIDNDEVDRDKPVLAGVRPGTYPLSYTDTGYHIYLFKWDNTEAVLAERHLPMEGNFNFRELGGIRTKEGKYTRWGKVFRSDDLAHLSESDIRYINTIPLRTIVDFRSQAEAQALPDAIPSQDTKYVPLPVSPGDLSENSRFEFSEMTEERSDSIMRAVNKQLVTDAVTTEQYRAFFALLQNEENTPLVFHCTAGKDRTGFGAYLFLSSLGVEQEVIMRDYLASNQYLTGKYDAYISQYPFIKPLLEVRRGFLQTAIDQINETYGSVENYLDQELNVDRKRMKDIYLY